MYSENFGFGQGGFNYRGTFNKGKKRLYMCTYEEYAYIHIYTTDYQSRVLLWVSILRP